MIRDLLPQRVRRRARDLRFRVRHRGLEGTFSKIYSRNYWASDESRSGPGSTSEQTAVVARELPLLLRELGVERFLDIPCGDFAWMKSVDLDGIDYIGCDIVEEAVRDNEARFGRPSVRFERCDLTKDPLPEADLALVRDCLVHLPNRHVWMVLDNLRRSGIEWVLMTTYPDRTENVDVTMGRWRPLNLELAPFELPPPERAILEHCTENEGTRADKTLGLWRCVDLPSAPRPATAARRR